VVWATSEAGDLKLLVKLQGEKVNSGPRWQSWAYDSDLPLVRFQKETGEATAKVCRKPGKWSVNRWTYCGMPQCACGCI